MKFPVVIQVPIQHRGFLNVCVAARRFACIVFLLIAGSFSQSSAKETSELALIARSADGVWETFSNQKGQIVAVDPITGGTKALPRDVRWELRGEIKKHGSFLTYSPFNIIRRLPPDEVSTTSRAFAMIWTTPSRQAKNGIIVAVWLVDGRPTIVAPIAATPTEERHYAAVHGFELEEHEMGGCPVTLVLSDNGFIRSEPRFADPEAQHVLECMHLGTRSDLQDAISRLKSVNVEDRRGASLLHVAADCGAADAVELLLAVGAKMGRTKKSQATPALWAAENGRAAIFRQLVGEGVEGAGAIDKNLVTRAMGWGHLEIVANIAERDPKLAAAELVTLATQFRRIDLVKRGLQLAGGAARAEALPWAVTRSFVRHDTDILELLLAEGLDKEAVVSGEPLLLHAAQRGNEPAIATLLRAGAKGGARNERGTTALMIAAHLGLTKSVELLLAGGCKVNIQNQDAASALHYAAASGKNSIVTLLLRHGAQFDLRDRKGNTALELALDIRATPVVEALVAAGARLDPKKPEIAERLIHAIALDEVELVRHAVERGWPAERPLVNGFRLTEAIEFCDGRRTRAWIRQALGLGSPRRVVENSPEVAARATKGTRPADSRPFDRAQPAISLQVSGVVDTHGHFLLPRLEGTDDPLLIRAVLNAIPTWQFTPGQKAGVAVSTPLTLAMQFRARDNRIFKESELDIPPMVNRSAPLSSSTYSRQVLVGHRQTPLWFPHQVGTGVSAPLVFEEIDVIPIAEEREGDYAVVTFVVEPDGRTAHPRVIDGTNSFVRGALDVLDKLSFQPGLRHGVPVRSHMTLVLQPDVK